MTAAALAIGFAMHILVERSVLNLVRRRPSRPKIEAETVDVPRRAA
jgi:hypothetical protein